MSVLPSVHMPDCQLTKKEGHHNFLMNMLLLIFETGKSGETEPSVKSAANNAADARV